MSDLKPCPFCGGTDVELQPAEQLDAVSWVASVECSDCQVRMEPSYCDSSQAEAEYSASIDWNRRPA